LFLLNSEADIVLIDPRDAFVKAAVSPRAPTQPDWASITAQLNGESPRPPDPYPYP
jgi:hypothetical protein